MAGSGPRGLVTPRDSRMAGGGCGTTPKHAQGWNENNQRLHRRRGADYSPMSDCVTIDVLLIAQPAAKSSCIKHQLAHSTKCFFFFSFEAVRKDLDEVRL